MLYFFRLYNKKICYHPINYVCNDETEFWIINENESGELDYEELENILYEEDQSMPINEVEGSSSATHVD